MSADWASIENALQAWVRAATSLDNAHVRWEYPNTGRPLDGLFCTLEILDRSPIGLVPSVVQTDHLSNPTGTEIELAATQVLDCAFRVQVYAPPARGTKPGTPRGPTNAAAVAEQIRLAVALPSNLANLDAVGVSVYDMGHVTYVPEIIGTDFEGRAVLDCRFYVADSASELTGYITTVGVSGTETTADGTQTVVTQTINGA